MMTKLKMILAITVGIGLGGCAGDNDYDGTTGLIQNAGSSVSGALETIDTAVLKAGSAEALAALALDEDNASLQAAQAAWTALVTAWKKVEATYVAEGLDKRMTDIPALLDPYALGGAEKIGSIPGDIEKVLSGSADVVDMMYKNSSKSVQSLEYLLFGPSHDDAAVLASFVANDRRDEAVAIAVEAVYGHLSTIEAFYRLDTAFAAGGNESLELLINTLNVSANRLMEWRIGDPGGFTAKHLGNPSAARLEYGRSGVSLEAMKAVLEAHQLVIENGLGDIAGDAGADAEIESIKTVIENGLTTIEGFEVPLYGALTDPAVEVLYDDAVELHHSYNASLISMLGLTGTIVEADGD